MDYRLLGRSGFKVSELTYGNWVTHGSQIEDEAAQACVHAALDCGITSFDTADVYARGRAEEILGRALRGQRREGLEIFTKVYGPMGEGPNDVGLSRKHIREGIEASLCRLQLDHVDLYRARRSLLSSCGHWPRRRACRWPASRWHEYRRRTTSPPRSPAPHGSSRSATTWERWACVSVLRSDSAWTTSSPRSPNTGAVPSDASHTCPRLWPEPAATRSDPDQEPVHRADSGRR